MVSAPFIEAVGRTGMKENGMSNIPATSAQQQPTARKGFWTHEDGMLRLDDEIYVGPDGVTPRFSLEMELASMEIALQKGEMDFLRWMLSGVGVPMIKRMQRVDYDARLDALQKSLADD